jgi:hypothetical protein
MNPALSMLRSGSYAFSADDWQVSTRRRPEQLQVIFLTHDCQRSYFGNLNCTNVDLLKIFHDFVVLLRKRGKTGPGTAARTGTCGAYYSTTNGFISITSAIGSSDLMDSLIRRSM